VWSFAAFGEELAYRGYLLNRAAEAGGGSKWAWGAGLIAASVLFGYGHYYKGPAGVIDSGFAGLVLGGIYLLNRRNLWTSILAHGFIDTIAVVFTFFGL
jgi:membrane protease YdiL (CAAX protease family)